MRDLVAMVFNCSLNGLLADPDTDFWRFCFDALDEHGGPDHDDATLGLLSGAAAHLMGRTAYDGMAAGLTTAVDHPWSGILTAGRKVVVSSTLVDPAWANTEVAPDLDAALTTVRPGAGTVIVWGGVRLWRSLMARDLLDEFRISLYPYLTDRGTTLFADVPPGYRLDLVSSVPDAHGVLELRYRRHR